MSYRLHYGSPRPQPAGFSNRVSPASPAERRIIPYFIQALGADPSRRDGSRSHHSPENLVVGKLFLVPNSDPVPFLDSALLLLKLFIRYFLPKDVGKNRGSTAMLNRRLNAPSNLARQQVFKGLPDNPL